MVSCGATVDSRAAHLKRPRRGLFARRTVRRASVALAVFSSVLERALKKQSAAVTAPPCFGRWPRSSPLHRGCFCAVFSDVAAAVRIHPRAPLETDTKQKAQRDRPHWERQLWGNWGFASRAAKNSPLGCFCAVFSDVAAAVRIHPRLWPQRSYIRKTPVYFYTSVFLVGAGGFEPPKLKAADLQSVPIGHSGTRPYSLFAVLRTACIYYHRFSSLSIFFVQIFRFLRCPAGSKMVECGLEKTAVQAILGHKNFSTTANKYVSHNDPAYLLQEMKKMKY